MKQIVYVHDLYVNRLKIYSISHDIDDMDLVGNDVDTLHGEIEYLLGHLVENDVDILHEERIHLMEFSFIRVID